jgi:hypothetical protein
LLSTVPLAVLPETNAPPLLPVSKKLLVALAPMATPPLETVVAPPLTTIWSR